jgi:long-chain acyl-CoA synthetase
MSITDARSFADLVRKRVAATPERHAFMYPTDPGWRTVTWAEAGERIKAIACGLRSLGLQDEQRCALLCATRYDWVVVDFGIMCGGGVTTTIYPSNTADESAYIITDAQCQVAFVENADQFAKLAERRSELTRLKKVIFIDGPAPKDPWVMTLQELEDAGRAHHAKNPGEYDAVIDRLTPQTLATLLYTSGTTGRPKGVELPHDCWLYESQAIDELDILKEDDLQYLWLPLSHSFGKVLEGALVRIGFVTAIDGRVERIVENLGEVKPTFVAAVPRVFEKVHNKVVAGAQEGGGLKYAIFKWAMSVGYEFSKIQQAGTVPEGFIAVKHKVADALVFSKLRDRFGGRLRFFISGGAPLSREIGEFFHAATILIAEGYGLTETSAASFVNAPLLSGSIKFGTVGPPLPGTQVKIAKEDGEILIRGRGVMRGYHNLPDATHETLDADGWLYTGDIGELDADGCLRITDRKKDLIKTSGGKYVAPQTLEGKFKAVCPYISQVLVHGNNRNFCSALITLDEESLRKWAAANGGGQDRPWAELVAEPRVVTMVQGYVNELNGTLASYETVKKFVLLPQDFTVENGMLTASLKMKRKLIEQTHKATLDGLYAEKGASV